MSKIRYNVKKFNINRRRNDTFKKNIIKNVRTQFGSQAQRMDEFSLKEPNTMNLQRVSWKTGL